MSILKQILSNEKFGTVVSSNLSATYGMEKICFVCTKSFAEIVPIKDYYTATKNITK